MVTRQNWTQYLQWYRRKPYRVGEKTILAWFLEAYPQGNTCLAELNLSTGA